MFWRDNNGAAISQVVQGAYTGDELEITDEIAINGKLFYRATILSRPSTGAGQGNSNFDAFCFGFETGALLSEWWQPNVWIATTQSRTDDAINQLERFLIAHQHSGSATQNVRGKWRAMCLLER